MLIVTSVILTASLALPPPEPAPVAPAGLASVQDAEKQLIDLERRWTELMREFNRAVRAAKPEERSKLYAKAPKADDLVPSFMTLAKDNPKTEVAAKALAWVMRFTHNSKSKSMAIETLLRDHLASEALVGVCATYEEDIVEGPEILTKILEGSPSEKVKGNACFSLAKNLKATAEIAEGLEAGMKDMYLGRYGPKTVEHVSGVDPKLLAEAAVEQFSRILVEFENVQGRRGPLGKAAESELFVLENLWYGKTAPEIEAADLDGVTFKLSDYRGKVVVLDFWGHW